MMYGCWMLWSALLLMWHDSVLWVLLGTVVGGVAATEISLGTLTTLAHRVTGEVVIVSERVLEIRGFVYDGQAPAAYIWADTNPIPSATTGFRLLDGIPSNGCGFRSIKRGANGTVTWRVEFPESSSVLDIAGGSIAIWCEQYEANFGQVQVPATLSSSNVLSTELGPALQCSDNTPTIPEIAQTPPGYNCEVLRDDDLQVRWVVVPDGIKVELVGVIAATDYMSFGVSGLSTRSFMVGADAVVVDSFGGTFRARDFYMNSRSQCSVGIGVCPDTDRVGGAVDDVDRTTVTGNRDRGVTVIRYKKFNPTSDISNKNGTTTNNVTGQDIDQPVSVTPGEFTFVVWAVGPVNQDVGLPQFHTDFNRNNVPIEFGRSPVANNCPPIVTSDETRAPEVPAVPYEIPVLRDVTDIVARIGPSGGERGYSAITGMASWGIAWYMNDLLIPVIELYRGTTYTFHVNGGDDPNLNAEYHPFYLTTSDAGGYVQLTPAERASETVFGGIAVTEMDSAGGIVSFNSTLQAPICLYEVTDATQEDVGDFQDFFDTLDTSCGNDSSITDAAAVFEFTPDNETPDMIYYHCVTHRNLGWQIRVLDAIPTAVTLAPAPSLPQPSVPSSSSNVPSLRPAPSLPNDTLLPPFFAPFPKLFAPFFSSLFNP